MRIKAVEVFPLSPLGRYYRGLLWEWSCADYTLYLEGRGFDDKEEFLQDMVEGQHEYVIQINGVPQAWFALQYTDAERGERLHFTCAPHADVRKLIAYLKGLVAFAKGRGAKLWADWPDDPKYNPARRLARLIGV